MSVFDELEEKAKELAAKAKAALENPDEFIAKTRERAEEAISEAREDVEEFATDAKKEFGEIRDKLVDLFDREPKADKAADHAEAPATASADPTSPTEEPPAPATAEPG